MRRRGHKVSATPYIRRRLLVTDRHERSVKCPEEDFFARRGPLVVLGAPGLGKSRLVEQFCKRSGTPTCVKATSLLARPLSQPLLEEEFPRKTVIDEIDAVITGGNTVDEVLARLDHFNNANFVLTCRSADWVESGLRAIKDKWGKIAMVGVLLPLDEEETARLVDSLETEWGGAEFLEAARERGLDPLPGNPQLLGMLLKVAGDDWPESKGDLYKVACRELAKEKNPAHRKLAGRHRPGADTLCDTAGFVCAQLLLSGIEGVGTTSSGGLPDADDLSSDAYPEHRVASALATNLFRARSDGALVPRHRTIAEYLAAKWLAKSLGKADLRPRDLEALLRTSNDTVPSSMRGVHAWVASLSKSKGIRSRFTKRDPHGFWCYGDRDGLSDAEAIGLLDALTAHARKHPGFYDENGQASLGRWSRADSLASNVASRIEDRGTPPDMVRLLVESVRGAPHSRDLKAALMGVVFDNRAPNRVLCLNSLARHMGDAALNRIVDRLVGTGYDIEPLCVANDAIAHHPGRISSKIIARALAYSRGQTEYMGLGEDEIYGRLSAQKARACLRETTKIATGPDTPWAYGAQRAIVPLLERLLELGAPPSPTDFWGHLIRVGLPWNFENGPNREISKYLAGHDEYRRKTQAAVILGMRRGELEARLPKLAVRWPALAVGPEDWPFLLEDLAQQRPQDWRRRWRELFRYGKGHGFSGSPMVRALELSKRHRFLHPPAGGRLSSATATEGAPGTGAHETRKTKGELELAKWRALFAQHQGEVASGRAVDLLRRAARTYFGHGSAEGATPEERITRLVGANQVDRVFAGIDNMVAEGTNIPTVRALAADCAQDRNTGDDYVLLVNLHRTEGSGDNFAKTRPGIVQSALAACHLNAWADNRRGHLQAQERLERIVFERPREAKRYFRDIVEPYLERGSFSVPGIDILHARPGLSEVAAQLSHEWMMAYPGLPNLVFRYILSLAHASHAHAGISKLVSSKAVSGSWSSPEERDNLMCAAFELDFPRQRRTIEAYANESKDRFWGLSDSLMDMKNPTPEQIQFVVETFAPLWLPLWPLTDYPEGMPAYGRRPRNASLTVINLIRMLESDVSKEATDALGHLAGLGPLGGYHRRIQQAYSTQLRNSFDLAETHLSLEQVRNVLLTGTPAGHRHLLAIVMETLDDLGDRIRNPETDEIGIRWAAPKGQPESHYRDRVQEVLTRELGGHGISVIPDARMSNGRRVTLLCQSPDGLRVPLEMRMGTIRDAQITPAERLSKHARAPGANRTAVYLVLWLGQAQGHQTAGCLSPDNRLPQSPRELKKMIDAHTSGVPYNLRAFVMDLSGGEESRGGLDGAFASQRHIRSLSGIAERGRQ